MTFKRELEERKVESIFKKGKNPKSFIENLNSLISFSPSTTYVNLSENSPRSSFNIPFTHSNEISSAPFILSSFKSSSTSNNSFKTLSSDCTDSSSESSSLDSDCNYSEDSFIQKKTLIET